MGVLVAIVFHELAHFIAAWFFHVPVKKVVFRWCGVGLVRPTVYGWKGAVICLAGIAANLIMCRMTSGFAHDFNLAMVGVNLLPLKCSDGFHAWQAISRTAGI